MPQPMPPPPPPKPKSLGLLVWLLIFLVAVGVLGYFQGWWGFNKDPETGKTTIQGNMNKFKEDKDIFLKKSGEALTKAKDKLASMMSKSKDAGTKAEDKAMIDKQIDELNKQLLELETKKKAAEAASDVDALKKATEGLDDTVKKLLESNPPK